MAHKISLLEGENHDIRDPCLNYRHSFAVFNDGKIRHTNI